MMAAFVGASRFRQWQDGDSGRVGMLWPTVTGHGNRDATTDFGLLQTLGVRTRSAARVSDARLLALVS